MYKFDPLEDRCLLRVIKEKELIKTDGGIYDPGTKQKPTAKGEVISVGPGFYARETGKLVNTVLSKGDIVLYGAGAGIEIDIETENGNETVRLLREGDCLLVISNK